jgi:hypothetical protein
MPRRRGPLAALLLAAAAAGCTAVSTDPEVPLSLQFDSLPAFAVVVGDTLRGGNQVPARIPIQAFNSSGGLLSDGAITLLGIDTASVRAFRVINGLFLVGVSENATVRLVAQAGSLQSQTQTFAVVPRPTNLVAGDTTRDSIVYDFTDSTKRFSDITASLVRTVPDSTARAINGLRIQFRVASFTASILDSVRIVSTGNGRSVTSALTTGGVATVRVKAYPKSGATGTGTIVIEAIAAVLGAPVPGSPLPLSIRLSPFTLPP